MNSTFNISDNQPPHKYATGPYYDINLQNSTIILTDTIPTQEYMKIQLIINYIKYSYSIDTII